MIRTLAEVTCRASPAVACKFLSEAGAGACEGRGTSMDLTIGRKGGWMGGWVDFVVRMGFF